MATGGWDEGRSQKNRDNRREARDRGQRFSQVKHAAFRHRRLLQRLGPPGPAAMHPGPPEAALHPGCSGSAAPQALLPSPLLLPPPPAPAHHPLERKASQASPGEGVPQPSPAGTNTWAHRVSGGSGAGPHRPRQRPGGVSRSLPAFAADCSNAHLGNITINPTAGFQISDCDGDCWRENRQLSAVSFT